KVQQATAPAAVFTMADVPSEGRKARTRIVKASAPSKVPAPSDGPTLLDAETFTHGGVPK
ncbi:hypothetical protein KI387_034620, partial [Taxus chinensis]